MANALTRGELLAAVAAEAPRQAAAAVRLSIAVAQQVGMPLTDVQCLGLLEAGPATPSDLAAQLGLTTGAVTKVLDRLEQSGFVSRAPDPGDRRRIVITAGPGGFRALAPYYAPMAAKMNEHLAGYGKKELATVLDFMRAGRIAADEEIARIREQGIRHATRRRAASSSSEVSSSSGGRMAGGGQEGHGLGTDRDHPRRRHRG